MSDTIDRRGTMHRERDSYLRRKDGLEGGTREQRGEFAEAMKLLKDIESGLNKKTEDLEKQIKAGVMTPDLKGDIDKALTTLGAVDRRLNDLEQKATRGAGGEAARQKSAGELVIESESFKAWERGDRNAKVGVKMDRKALTTAPSTQGDVTSVSTSLVPAQRLPGIQELPQRTLFLRDLITPGSTDSNAIEYVVETLFTNAARPVAETTKKPYSDFKFDMKNTPVRTIAHLAKASRQIMDDAPQLSSFVDGRMRFGVREVEEDQMLFGDGTGQNLLGIIPQASAFVNPLEGRIDPAKITPIDRIRLAMLQAVKAKFPATGHVLNDVDWTLIDLTKDANGVYVMAKPQGITVPTLWGLPVVTTQSMTEGRFLTGAFRLGAQYFQRMEIEVLISSENVDDFENNMLTVRAEERLALAVYRPQAFVTGDVDG